MSKAIGPERSDEDLLLAVAAGPGALPERGGLAPAPAAALRPVRPARQLRQRRPYGDRPVIGLSARRRPARGGSTAEPADRSLGGGERFGYADLDKVPTCVDITDPGTD